MSTKFVENASNQSTNVLIAVRRNGSDIFNLFFTLYWDSLFFKANYNLVNSKLYASS